MLFLGFTLKILSFRYTWPAVWAIIPTYLQKTILWKRYSKHCFHKAFLKESNKFSNNIEVDILCTCGSLVIYNYCLVVYFSNLLYNRWNCKSKSPGKRLSSINNKQCVWKIFSWHGIVTNIVLPILFEYFSIFRAFCVASFRNFARCFCFCRVLLFVRYIYVVLVIISKNFCCFSIFSLFFVGCCSM